MPPQQSMPAPCTSRAHRTRPQGCITAHCSASLHAGPPSAARVHPSERALRGGRLHQQRACVLAPSAARHACREAGPLRLTPPAAHPPPSYAGTSEEEEEEEEDDDDDEGYAAHSPKRPRLASASPPTPSQAIAFLLYVDCAHLLGWLGEAEHATWTLQLLHRDTMTRPGAIGLLGSGWQTL
jgi:hypothetical protein